VEDKDALVILQTILVTCFLINDTTKSGLLTKRQRQQDTGSLNSLVRTLGEATTSNRVVTLRDDSKAIVSASRTVVDDCT